MSLKISPFAGQIARDVALNNPGKFKLVDVNKLRCNFYHKAPLPKQSGKLVEFGTSGHRGNPFEGTFNEAHIIAITQAIIDFRNETGISGPLYLGMDSHPVSLPAMVTALRVLFANKVPVRIQKGWDNKNELAGFTPTPAVSLAILNHNAIHSKKADGIIITPSHNPPTDGGIKYNPPEGGPASTRVTQAIEIKANEILRDNLRGVKIADFNGLERMMETGLIKYFDFRKNYVDQLDSVIDMAAIRRWCQKGNLIGVDPLGGASLEYWPIIAEKYGLNLEIINPEFDLTFQFMPLDWDGQIRMDCSSSYVMSNLNRIRNKFAISFAQDTDADRHGIIDPKYGLLNSNHYLSVMTWYLLNHRPNYPKNIGVGKTMVTSVMIDKIAEFFKLPVYTMPVGFKYFVEPILSREIFIGMEESAGATFLRRDGSIWTTDKDGIIPCLLAAEMIAVTGKTPGEIYKELETKFGKLFFKRSDTVANSEDKSKLKKAKGDDVKKKVQKLGGHEIIEISTEAPHGGSDNNLGGIFIRTKFGWVCARPSGTEEVIKIYGESFVRDDHLELLLKETVEVMKIL